MVSYDQAVQFLDKVLRMPPSWRDLIQSDPKQFLTIYLKRHAIRVPFQGIEMAAKDLETRWFPSEYDYIQQGLTGNGGCCIHLNYFSMLVLRTLGMDCFVVRGDHYCAPVAGTHCILMVNLHGPKDFGLYMVEAGGYYPILEPIPMEKEKLPYRTLQAAGFPYEFREFAPGWIGKFHLGGGIMGGKFEDKAEVLRTSWDRKPRGLWEFDYPMLETFTNPAASSMLRFPVMYRFFRNSEFRRLFPELPENQNVKEKVLTTTRKSLSQKVLVASGKPKTTTAAQVEPKKTTKPVTATPIIPTNNNKNLKKDTSNAKELSGLISSLNSSTINNKDVSKKLTITNKPESEDEEYEVVTEDEVESAEDDDDLEDPQNFVYVWKRRIVIGDSKTRKIVKNYDNYETMGEDLKKYFPMVPAKAMDKAMKVYSEHEVEFNPYDSIL